MVGGAVESRTIDYCVGGDVSGSVVVGDTGGNMVGDVGGAVVESVVVGDTDGDTVGYEVVGAVRSGVVGDTDGNAVGSEVVGTTDGDAVGSEMVFDPDGDTIGSEVVSWAMGAVLVDSLVAEAGMVGCSLNRARHWHSRACRQVGQRGWWWQSK